MSEKPLADINIDLLNQYDVPRDRDLNPIGEVTMGNFTTDTDAEKKAELIKKDNETTKQRNRIIKKEE